VQIQPQDKTLAEADIEALSSKIIASVEKNCGGRLRA
jgi:phenylalanyl-tRNA synthetase beta chain